MHHAANLGYLKMRKLAYIRRAMRTCVIGLVLGLSTIPAAIADDVTEQLNDALKAYENKDLTAASAALDSAGTLIRQMVAEAWKAVLPEPLGGWDAGEAESTSVGTAMLGGGTSVSRKYHRNNESVEITLMTGSPILQGLGALLGGGMVTSSDMKLSIVDGRKMTYTKSENSYQTLVGGKALVKIEGSKGVDDVTLRAYVAAIKFPQIEKAVR
jgi:hypothetical protein